MKKLFDGWRSFLTEEMTKDGASIVFVFNDNDEMLLLKRNKEAPWMPEKWATIGGGVEKGEDPKTAAKREAEEETQIKINKLSKVKTSTDHSGKVYHFVSKDGEWEGNPKINFEHTNMSWVKVEDLKNYDIVPQLEKDAKDALNHT